ncbi:hypothetical protein N0V83_007427 [Neocucurbitaria cava]|uniref:Glucose-methanol-choline oxidoreductase N-terminal domain-containing protein n=1 Tax=Neocucurbitaria cava TaxID=798079 RepID=A0A9W8Y499_9PLEO|nr:hypothetical protein N0V83_007427 [Neocucurbitaria cava]
MVNLRLEVLTLFALAFAGANALSERQLLNQTYDYIIVGGGTSGLTVANRLTANGKRSVLVVEYGELNNDPSILIPTDTLNFHPDRFYNITSLPMPGLNNITSRVSAGALVGGGSAVNGMFFDRGSKSDYDAWETLGNPGWSFKDLLPYFKKSVTFTPPSPEVAAKYNYTWDVESAYGGHGEIQESFPPYQFPGQDYLWRAWAEIGVKKPSEAANGEAIGAIQAPSALDPVTRTRSYARTAHYEPFANRSNYHLLTGYQATEILFKDGGDLEAVGVSIVKRGTAQKTTVIAKREVIVAAGALWTPWLLQRSGVGPIEVLKSAGIKVKKNLPGVGANFQDHPLGGTTWNWTKSTLYPTPGTLASNATFFEEARKEYEQFRTGPFTPARGNQAAFLPLSTVNPKGWQSLVDAVTAQDPTPYLPKQYEATLVKGFKAQQQLTAQLLARDDSAAYEFPFSSGPLGNGVLSRPLSRGTVNINTTDPSREPVVDFRTFSNPLDIQMALPIVHFTRRFNFLSSLASLGPSELTPGLNVSSDAQIEAHLRATFNPTFAHPSGTASLLPEEDGGVVGPDLKVHGIAKLSVIDASVIPYLPATHLCTTVYAVAEKAADLIKARTAWDD